MRIRNARIDDAGAIAEIHRDSWREAYDGMLPVGYLRDMRADRLESRWRQQLSRRAVRDWAWVAEAGGAVAGFVRAEQVRGDDSLRGFAGEITMIYVHPRHQGAGLGRGLFETARTNLAAAPLYWLVVWVVEANLPARRFYDRVGLIPDGTRRIDQFPGAPVSVIRFVGPLNSITESGVEVL